MTSDNYKWHQQTRFDGGIQVQPEVAKPNQVIDASNYWTPQSRCDRRPGSSLNAGFASYVGAYTPLGVPTATPFVKIGDVGTFAYTGGALPINISRIALNSNSSGPPVYTLAGGYASVLLAWQIYTTRGWVSITGTQSSGSGASSDLFTNALGGGVSVITLSFFNPTDYRLEPTTNNLFRCVVTGAITPGGAFVSTVGTTVLSLNNFDGGAGASIGYITPASLTTYSFRGAYQSKYASGTISTGVSVSLSGNNTTVSIGQMAGLLGGAKSPTTTTFTRVKNPAVQGPPASFTIIPEFNTGYITVDNAIYEIPYTGLPTTAQVNSDPLIVGPTDITSATTSIYPSDQIPQLPNFPPANLIVYFRDRLWAAGLQGQPATIRWGAAASTGNGPAYNVWPSASFVQLSTAQDNSPITAIAALADNLVVFKKNSIWLMIDRGTDANGLALFEPRLVVAGVGCLAHNSVRAIFGKGLMFLAEDGFYLFDGTPNVKCISDPIKTFVTQISPARAPFAQAVNWRRQQVYLCAVSLNGEMNSNNFVFCYDYQADAWWVWQGWDVQCWYQDDGVGLKEEIWFFDRYGRASKLEGGDTDNGTPISSYLTTHRFGEFDIVSTAIDEVRLQTSNQADVLAPVTVGVITEDIQTIEGKDKSVVIPLDGETLWADPPVSGVSTWVPDRRRERKKTFKVTGKWVQMTVKNALQVIMLACGYLPDSRR